MGHEWPADAVLRGGHGQHAGKPATDGWFSTAWYSIEKWDFNGDLIGV